MKLISRKMFFAAAAVLMTAAAGGIILFDRDTNVDTEKRLGLAGEYLESSDYDNAIAIYNGIIAENDECSAAYIGLAEAYYAKNKTEKSLEILERGLEYSDDEDAVFEKLAELFPDNLPEDMLSEEDEYSAEEDYAETETEIETETAAETTVAETETSPTEETSISETETVTAAPETTTAVPVTTAPATTTAARTTVTTTSAATTTTTAAETTTTAEPEPQSVVVDDLTMMTADEARKWCSENNLSLAVIGDGGLIVSQSPAPGSVVFENSEIIVRCE